MSKEQSEKLTQQYSTWGDKLLQHADVLYDIQHNKKFTPITIQLAPTENCTSDCPFCSVAGRPLKSYMPFSKITKCLSNFKYLGAKSVENTGGGEPLIYFDKEENKRFNDIINLEAELGYEIGIITNSNDLKYIDPALYSNISWIRISLIKLDEGFKPEDYNFRGFPANKLAFSYIIYDGTGDQPDSLSRTKKPYAGTTKESIEKIAELVAMHPEIKFVRLAGNCLIKGNNAVIRDQYQDVIDAVDKYSKFFIKDIGSNDSAFDDGCYVGAVRPYVAPHPNGGDYQIYTCTSHVLNTRTYDLNYSLGSADNVLDIWEDMSINYRNLGYPYEVKGNKGCGWSQTCKYCYYHNNNKLLNTVAQPMPDKNFA